MAFASLRRPFIWPNAGLSIKDRVYTELVRAILLYDSVLYINVFVILREYTSRLVLAIARLGKRQRQEKPQNSNSLLLSAACMSTDGIPQLTRSSEACNAWKTIRGSRSAK